MDELSQVPFKHSLKNQLPFLLAACVFLLLTFQYFLYPLFPGDSGSRMLSSNVLLLHDGPRLWLPFTQVHIYLLHKLDAAPFFYDLVSPIYFIGTLYLLNRISQTILAKNLHWQLSFLFPLVFLVCNSTVQYLGVFLYQETPSTFFFFFLVYRVIIVRKFAWTDWMIAALSFFIRENNWVYLFFFSIPLLDRRSFSAKQRGAFLALFLIPISFLLLTHQGLLPATKVDTTTLALESYGARAYRIASVIFANYYYLSFGTICLFLLGLTKVKPISQWPRYLLDYTAVSLLSLLTLFFYFVWRDPFQGTPTNPRMAYPFLVLTILFFPMIIALTQRRKFVTCLLIGSSFFYSYYFFANFMQQLQFAGALLADSTKNKALSETMKFEAEHMHKARLKILLFHIDYFMFLQFFLAPMINHQLSLIKQNPLDENFDLLFSGIPIADPRLTLLQIIERKSYPEQIYFYRRLSPPRLQP